MSNLFFGIFLTVISIPMFIKGNVAIAILDLVIGSLNLAMFFKDR